jgi:type III restriction enzyme
MHPDFVFFHEVGGKIVASIIDPHGHHLDDARMKLRALAAFARKYGDAFHRIEAVAEADGSMKVLDMRNAAVRDAVLAGKQPPIDLYRSSVAVDYNPTLKA